MSNKESDNASSHSSEYVAVGNADEVAAIFNIENGAESEFTDDTQSLTSSIRQHIVEGGLRYHAYHAGQYAFPNDESEQHRDDLKHDLTLHLCDGKYLLAPIHNLLSKGGEVLDLGMLQDSLQYHQICLLTICPRHGQWKMVHRV